MSSSSSSSSRQSTSLLSSTKQIDNQKEKEPLSKSTATITPEEKKQKLDTSTSKTTKTTKEHTCKFCSATFTSRNALFRHIKTSCTAIPTDLLHEAKQLEKLESVRQSVAFKIAYYSTTSEKGKKKTRSEGDIGGERLLSSFTDVLNEYYAQQYSTNTAKEENKPVINIISSSQVSATKQRHTSLQQEGNCAALGDIITIHYSAPLSSSSSYTNKLFHQTKERVESSNKNETVKVYVLDCIQLSSSSKQTFLHAENDCTQRIYHYIFPLKWLPDGEQLQDWWMKEEQARHLQETNKVEKKTVEGGVHTGKFRSKPPSTSLRTFAKLLRKPVSEILPNRKVRRRKWDTDKAKQDAKSNSSNDDENEEDDDGIKMASGRYGALANKQRKPFHNYADPSLQGGASPNNEPVWRVVDSAKICRIFPNPNKQNEVLVDVEIKGDHFLPQQIRRIVGTALVMCYGWLPPTIFEETLDKDVFVETICAPIGGANGCGGGYLYMDECRFHFDQLCRGGKKSLFERHYQDNGGEDTSKQEEEEKMNVNYDKEVEWIQKQILLQHSSSSDEEEEDDDESWLREARNVIAPRIRKQLDLYKNVKSSHDEQNQPNTENNVSSLSKMKKLSPPPGCYNTALTLLQNIVETNTWPDTSVARSKVIRNVPPSSSLSPNKDEESKNLDVKKPSSSGSFTVVNPKRQVENYQLPLASTLFPELVQAVFDLEETLSQTHTLKQTNASIGNSLTTRPSNTKRPSSSHCAINCNAQFTPHVDSGRGSGQSLSMIVGLGDYVHGELAVEGTLYDIRYEPLEFDGWKLRHWTNLYEGERFSLVWFTPAEFDAVVETKEDGE